MTTSVNVPVLVNGVEVMATVDVTLALDAITTDTPPPIPDPTVPGPLPEGGLLLIPAGTSKPSNLSSGGSMLWDAAAKYGVYITDQLGGGPMFYSDGSSTVNNAINGNDYSTVGRALRLVKTW